MNKFEILQELLKCDTETQGEQNPVGTIMLTDVLNTELP